MKRLIAMLLALVLTMSMMVGCGNSAGNEETEGPVKVEFWHAMGSTTGELLREIVDDFNKAHEGEIVVEAIYQGDYTTAMTKLQAAAGSGSDMPEVVQVEITRVGMYADAGMLMDLKPFDDADHRRMDDAYSGDLQPSGLCFDGAHHRAQPEIFHSPAKAPGAAQRPH